MEKLTSKQQTIFDFIKNKVNEIGIVPSIREICAGVNLSSTSTVKFHLDNIEKKGYIKRQTGKNRTIEIIDKSLFKQEFLNVPILGSVSAGIPNMAEEYIEGYFQISPSYIKGNDVFMLKISGNSMINAGILNEDLVIVNKQNIAKNKEIVIALLDGETTCKRLIIEEKIVKLKPENELYDIIISNNIQIIGKVIGLFRNM